MDLTAPPLVPIAALALASSGQVAQAPARPDSAGPPRPGQLAGTTAQGRQVALRLRPGGRGVSWRVGYVARCGDGTVIRGRYVSGDGTPPLDLGEDGRFRLSREEPARFRREATGSARFEFSGRIRPSGGTGSWRLTLVTPPGPRGRLSCVTGPVAWRAAPR